MPIKSKLPIDEESLKAYITDDKLLTLIKDIPFKQFAKGAFIYKSEESADKIYYVVKGQVKLGAAGDSGREITKTILNPGEFFGELSLIDEGKRTDYASAVENSIIGVLEVSDFKNLIKVYPDFGNLTIKSMGLKLADLERKLESMVFLDSKSRIIAFIVEQTERIGQRVGYEWVIRNFMTHQEIANITATSRQSVTTVLNELRSNGLIIFDRKRLLIRDLHKLKSFLNIGHE
jgi:CRP/FNR family cyclic AMP-dependent transcriptional regulator